ncbi:MAG: acyltransferase family protein [Alphaproteobacteria bacterium]
MIQGHAHKGTKYRPDIDGLRAVAVMAVAACHVEMPFCHGGFIGVDVFFIISGYLISRIIATEIEAGNFSIVNFYERRIRRIIPALVVTMLGATAIGYAYLMPTEMKDFSKSIPAALFSASNFLFWSQAGYFEGASMSKPLLHTWSLAVEEQFYIFFPLLLMLAYRRFRRHLKLTVLGLAVFSLGLSAYGVAQHSSASYYLLHSRAWELLIGCVLGMRLVPEIRGALWRNLASLAGLAMILVCVPLYSSDTPFPGFAALLPCLGAALFIAAGETGESWGGKLLSLPPVVFIGLISYSLYLWHWPVIVFHGMGFMSAGLPPRVEKFYVIGLSIVLAAASWKFVETPFRDRKSFTRPVLFRWAGAAAAFCTLLAIGIVVADGLAFRYSPQVIKIASYMNYDGEKTSKAASCFIESGDMVYDPSFCLQRSEGKNNDYLLLGDSHAAHLWHGLSAVFPDLNIMQAAASGCKPTLNHSMSSYERCTKLMDYVFREYLPAHRVNVLLIAGRWNSQDVARLPETLAYAKKYADAVVLFGPMVQYDAALPRLLALSAQKNDAAYSFRHRVETFAQLDGEMAKLAAENGVRYISFFDVMCPGGQACETMAGEDVPIQFDYGHLTAEGSAHVFEKIRKAGMLPVLKIAENATGG